MKALYILILVLFTCPFIKGQSLNSIDKDTSLSFTLQECNFQLTCPVSYKVRIIENHTASIYSDDSILYHQIQIKPLPERYQSSIRKASKKMMNVIASPWGGEPKENFKVVKNKNIKINGIRFKYLVFQWSRNKKLCLGYMYLKILNKKLVILSGSELSNETQINKDTTDFWRSLKIKQ